MASSKLPAANLVAIHGAGSKSEGYRPLAAALAAQLPLRFLALDLPGHGAAPPAKPAASLDEYALAVEECLAQEQLSGPLVLMGHSMGGAVVQRLAHRGKITPSALVLIATGDRLPISPSLLGLLREDPGSAMKLSAGLMFGSATPMTWRRAIMEPLMPAPEPAVVLADFECCDAFDDKLLSPSLKLPSLVVIGAEDQFVSPRRSRGLAQRLPQSKLLSIPGAGHLVVVEGAGRIALACAELIATLGATQ